MNRFVGTFLVGNLRGIYPNNVIEKILETNKMDKKRIKIFIDLIIKHRLEIRDIYLYQNSYNLIFNEIPNIKQTQMETNQLLEALLNELKKRSSGEPP